MNADQVRQATEKLTKARAEITVSQTFYAVLIANVEPVITDRVPTMATDGKRHYANPAFIAGMDLQMVKGVQRHESEHDARHHHTRRNGRDPQKWNEACDFAINYDLVQEGMVIGVDLPRGALYDPRFAGMSAEDIYRIRELDAQQQQPQPNNSSEEADDETDQNDDQAEASDDGNGEDADDQDRQEDGDAETAGADGEDDEGEAGEASGDGDEAEREAGDEADKSSSGAADADGATEGESQGNTEADGDGGEAEPVTSGDPGGCGEVLDAADDAAELADEDNRWERITRQAVSLSKSRGDLPGHITREIERANNPDRDWRETLREFFDGGSRNIETWSKPNRRFAHNRGVFMPGSQREGVNKAVFVIDTSGSMDDIALRCINEEAQAALDDGIIDEIVVVYGDTRVTRVDTYGPTDEIVFDPRGGGGTDLRPLFQYVADEVSDASMMIVFTDGYLGDPGPEPHCPALFAFTGYPDVVRGMIQNAPWGSAGIDVGSH